ncbi:hypothetical protein GCM10011501_05080 [Thalassotalea profundi]|uniref:Uncharacterized protein n=2 Tax=Thalassotalea profundi TaxID=2036687 RepID=A0ABQ3IDA8_9GAMM|nr:hypothetical protein GCM10011501_05080 [Thalassotalea profundi]
MSTQLSKLCADHLRVSFNALTGEKLKASHAVQLVAAFFGYKSHAALLADHKYPIDLLEEAYIFIPNVELIEVRRKNLSLLPVNLPTSIDIAKELASFLANEQHTSADIWLHESFETYCLETLLVNCQDLIDDQLSGVMAETNAGFWNQPWYEIESIENKVDELVITASAKHEGEPLDDKPFSGDTIDFQVHISFPRIAGRRGFYDFDLEAVGSVNDDWVDPALKYSAQQSVDTGSPLAIELGITNEELEELDYEVYENASNDGLIYDYVIQFSQHNDPELLAKISGLDEYNAIRVSVNAFDEPPSPFDTL